MNSKTQVLVLLVIIILSVSVGYLFCLRKNGEALACVKETHRVDRVAVVASIVTAIQREAKFVTYGIDGWQKVAVDRQYWGLFSGHQSLVVPARINYFVDFQKFTADDVSYDQKTNTVSIKSPQLLIDINLKPERAAFENHGILALSPEFGQALEKINYAAARKSALDQGRQREFLNEAKSSTRLAIKRLFEIPFRVAGMADVKFLVTFPDESNP